MIESQQGTPIVHYLYEPGDGGLDRVAILLANAMTERGEPTELWMGKTEGPISDLISPKVTVRKVPGLALAGRGLHLFTQIPSLARMIRKHRPRAIFSAGNQSNLAIALARRISRSERTKAVQKITNPVERPSMGAVRKMLRRNRFGMTARLGDLCLVLSKTDADHYAKLFPSAANRFRTIHNAYVTPEMLAAGNRRSPRPHSDVVRLLAVGRLARQKDYPTMLRALAQIADRSWRLTILGDGPERDELGALADSLGLADRIEFAGFVDDVTSHYAQSDLLVLSSRWEGLPAAPLEALAAGCDVIATDCSPGLTEILRMSGRSPTPVGDAAALAFAVDAWLEVPPSTDALIDIATAYSVEESVEDHLNALARLGA